MPPCASATSALKTCAQARLGDVTVLLAREVPTGTEYVIGGKGFKLLTDHIPASWFTVALADFDYEAKRPGSGETSILCEVQAAV